MNLPMIRRHKENVSMLLAGLIDPANGTVGRLDALDRGFVHTRVAHHVRRRKVIHDKLVLALSNALGDLLTHLGGAHLRVQVVSRHLGGRDHVAIFARELLLNAAVEEEGNVGVLLRLSDVALLQALLAEPFRQHVTHVLRGEGNREGVVGLVLGHGGDVDILGVFEVGCGRTVNVAEKLGDFAHPVGSVVEEEEGVAIYQSQSSYTYEQESCCESYP